MNIDKPGFYDMPAHEYHADPCCEPSLSSSVAQAIISRSPAHAKLQHPRLGGMSLDSTDAMDFGTVCHELLLGKGAGIKVLDVDDFRTKAAQKARSDAEMDGFTAIKKSDHERALSAIGSWLRQLSDFHLEHVAKNGVGESEKVAVWRDDNGVWCRAMIDRLFLESGEIWDLKTTSDASPAKCVRKVIDGGFDLRSQFYIRGVEKLVPALAGRVKMGFLFCETEAPFAITPVTQLDGQWRHIGAEKCQRAIEIFGTCLKSGVWPGYVDKPVTMECPSWEVKKHVFEGGEME